MSFLFGSSGQKPAPFRGYGWEQQGRDLHSLFSGQLYAANPGLMAGNDAQIASLQQQIAALQNGGASGQFDMNNVVGMADPSTYIMRDGSRVSRGQANISGNLTDLQAQLAALQGQQAIASGYAQQFQNMMAGIPEQLQFAQRSPYEFSNFNFQTFNPDQALGDAYTPAYAIAQRQSAAAQEQDRKAMNDELARRGLYTSGAATEQSMRLGKQYADRLANSSDALLAQQAQQRLGAYQFANQQQMQQQNMEFQRQQAQAAELFRQQGATDAQAQQMAQYAMQRNAYANQLQRQPQEDLFRLYQLSTGATPGSPAQPGLLQALAPAAGAAGLGALAGAVGGGSAGLGALAGLAAFCLPKGTKIESPNGGINVEEIRVGDFVTGGEVIAITQRQRNSGHKFFEHVFEKGSVVMSDGHPYFDELKAISESENDSQHTYDILTDSGFYYVNGIKLGSTIGKGMS